MKGLQVSQLILVRMSPSCNYCNSACFLWFNTSNL